MIRQSWKVSRHLIGFVMAEEYRQTVDSPGALNGRPQSVAILNSQALARQRSPLHPITVYTPTGDPQLISASVQQLPTAARLGVGR
jgi:hypothetical protein